MIGFYLWILFFMIYFFITFPWWFSLALIVLSFLAANWKIKRKKRKIRW